MLAVQTLTVSGIAEHFKVSRPAISKHVKILAECGLVNVTQDGRERYIEAKLKKLDEVTYWVETYRQLWSDRLDRLEEYLKELQSEEKSHGNKI
jgi:DNA-binding transcriptional ArsR family regulator